VPNSFLTESPLPPLRDDGSNTAAKSIMKNSRVFVHNDVNLEDILNAPSSLSVSLKTLTNANELSFF
jgi:hypothetical protein